MQKGESMGSLGRTFSVIVAIAFLFPFMIMHRIQLETTKNRETIECRINNIYERIKKNRVLTASDLLELRETAALCDGKLMISIGCEREVIRPENHVAYCYKEYLYTDEIENLVKNEGKIILLTGESLSIVVNPGGFTGINNIFSLRRKAGLLTAGGVM